MKILTVRVDDELAGQLQRLAAMERETLSTIARRAVRRHVEDALKPDTDLARAHEDTGRVR